MKVTTSFNQIWYSYGLWDWHHWTKDQPKWHAAFPWNLWEQDQLWNTSIFFNLFYQVLGAKVWIGIVFLLKLVDIMVTKNTQGHNIPVDYHFFLYKAFHGFICNDMCCKHFKIRIFICIWWSVIIFPCLTLTIKVWVAGSWKWASAAKKSTPGNLRSKPLYPSFCKSLTICSILVLPNFLWPQLVNVSVDLNIFPPDVVVFLFQNRQISCGNTNLLPSSEGLFQRERDDERCAFSSVPWDSDCKWLRFIVKNWWYHRCHLVFSRSISEKESWINLHTSSMRCLESAFSFSCIEQNFELFIWRRSTHYETWKVANIW